MRKLSWDGMVAGYWFRGVDDWFCFVEDQKGNWFFFNTEKMSAWNDLDACHSAYYSETGVAYVALRMAIAGHKPEPIPSEYLSEIVTAYGE